MGFAYRRAVITSKNGSLGKFHLPNGTTIAWLYHSALAPTPSQLPGLGRPSRLISLSILAILKRAKVIHEIAINTKATANVM